MSRLQVRLVGSARPSRNVQRDRDMETTWCSEFSRLQQLLASRGGDLIIERFGRDKTVFQPRGSMATMSVVSCNDGRDRPFATCQIDPPWRDGLKERPRRRSLASVGRHSRAAAPPERCCTSSANDTLRQSIPRWKFGGFSNRPSGSSLHARGMVSFQLGSRGTARDRRGNYGNLPTAVVMRRLIAET